jgi:hypothetical protein
VAHIHFAWELGGGLGHAGRIKPLAAEALRRGHQVSMCLRELVHTHSVLAPLGVPRLQAPVWLHEVKGLPSPQISLAEILLTMGYVNADALQGLFSGWRDTLILLKPDLVVADSAPTAVLAARSLGVRSATVGIGYFMPPEATPMPVLRDWEPVQPGRVQAGDQQMLSAINTVLERVGAAPLHHAAQALLGDAPLHLTWPELDHYGRTSLPAGQTWWGPSMLSGAGVVPQWPALDGPRVFAYLKTDHPDHALVLQALVKLGCVVECYLPEVASGRPPPVVSPRIHYSAGPVDLQAALPGCALCICHGGEATLAQALLLEVPVLLLPTQAEQFLISRCVGRAGLGINAAERRRPLDYAAVMQPMLAADGPFKRAAVAFAHSHADFSSARHTLDLVDEFERQLSLR